MIIMLLSVCHYLIIILMCTVNRKFATHWECVINNENTVKLVSTDIYKASPDTTKKLQVLSQTPTSKAWHPLVDDSIQVAEHGYRLFIFNYFHFHYLNYINGLLFLSWYYYSFHWIFMIVIRGYNMQMYILD